MSIVADEIRDAEILELQRRVKSLEERVRSLETRMVPPYAPTQPYPLIPAVPMYPVDLPHRPRFGDWPYRVYLSPVSRGS